MSKIIIYGRGEFWKNHRQEVEATYEIISFLDTFYQGEYENYFCEKVSEHTENKDADLYLIMSSNYRIMFEMLHQLLKVGINSEKIKLGYFYYGAGRRCFENADIQKNGSLRVCARGIELVVSDAVELESVYETIVCKAYEFCLNNKKDSIVLDVGANIGDSTLYFLQRNDIRKVYAYEPFKETYDKAKDNLKDYLDTSRLQLNNFGLSNVNESRTLSISSGMSIGLSTDCEALKKNEQLLCIDGTNQTETMVIVKNAAEEISPIIAENAGYYDIILKMDCEGEEFVIMEELDKTDLLKEVDLIMLEWHYRDEKEIVDILIKNHFKYVLQRKSIDLGLIWAWRS